MKWNTAFLFPGQGAQYPGMGSDFYRTFPAAKQTFEEADDLLGRKLSDIILQGPEDRLLETQNSQTGIFVVSVAILRVIRGLFPELAPAVCAGLSLGEYTALAASGALSFSDALQLVQHRSRWMQAACEENKGAMAVILGLDAEAVDAVVRAADLPQDLWVANYNCPGQIVISGTLKGIEAGCRLAKEMGAKRTLSLPVHGAFHSGLMTSARERLRPYIEAAPIRQPAAKLVMNVSGRSVDDPQEIKHQLIEQVTGAVRWEQGVRAIEEHAIGLYVEMGPGKTLSGFNKRIGAAGTTLGIEKVEEIASLEQFLKQTSIV